jgi:ATP-dependent Clp protease adaptor protein ClpS
MQHQESFENQTEIVDIIEQSLILHNDYNHIDHVIHCLVNIMDFDPIQSEQIAYIVHFKGKCPIKSGTVENLKPFHKMLAQQGLTVSID